MGTFGYSTLGTGFDNQNDWFYLNSLMAYKALSPTDCGTITKISAYVYAPSGTTTNMKAAIYSNVLGAPGVKLAESTEVAGINDTPAWHDFTLTAPFSGSPYTYYFLVLLASTDFYFAFYNRISRNRNRLFWKIRLRISYCAKQFPITHYKL